MVCCAYFGELSKWRRERWDNGESNPYKILSEPIELPRKGNHFWDYGDRYFFNQIRIDWGSFAWKCTGDSIIRFLEDNISSLPWLKKDEKEMIEAVKRYIEMHKETEYGVVFIESV